MQSTAYRLYTVFPRLLHLIDSLTNWYIRFNRKRLKGQAGLGIRDTHLALNTLFEVLFILVRALAPFMPFLTDHIYQQLVRYLPKQLLSSYPDIRSVHFLPFPEAREDLFDEDIERRMARMQKVIELARTARERCGIGLKTPLLTLVDLRILLILKISAHSRFMSARNSMFANLP
jgi:isoleucyl-tRNA synthetase